MKITRSSPTCIRYQYEEGDFALFVKGQKILIPHPRFTFPTKQARFITGSFDVWTGDEAFNVTNRVLSFSLPKISLYDQLDLLVTEADLKLGIPRRMLFKDLEVTRISEVYNGSTIRYGFTGLNRPMLL